MHSLSRCLLLVLCSAGLLALAGTMGCIPPRPNIALNETTLNSSVTDCFGPAKNSFTVRNSGGGTLKYSITSSAAWLTVSPASGSSTGQPNTVTISYDTAGLAAASYPATITVTDPNAENKSKTISVELTIEQGRFPDSLSTCCDVQGNAICGVFLAHRWAKRELTYSFHNFSDQATGAAIEAAYRQACDRWQAVTPLSFSRVGDNGDIQIYAVDQTSPDYGVLQMDLFPATAELPNGSDHAIVQRIDAGQASTWSANLRARIAAHELGHSLGLMHIEQPEAIMYGMVVDDGTTQVALQPADIAAIQSVYGKPGDVTAPPIVFPPIKPLADVPAPGNDDQDGDGLDTGTELLLTWPTGKKSDPSNQDSDGDGLPDGYEVANGLDPTNPDTNGNGIDDKTEIELGMDPRPAVVVLDPGNVVVQDGATLCALPPVGENTSKLGLPEKDYVRAGFAVGDVATVTLATTGMSASNVEIVKWSGTSCAAWLTQDLQTALNMAAGGGSELLIRRVSPSPTDLAVIITYPQDGDFVPGATDLTAKILGGNGQQVYLQFFVLAPDAWRYYPQQGTWLTTPGSNGTAFARAMTYLGSSEYHDGLTFKVWAELRSDPAPIVDDGVPGPPPEPTSPCLARSRMITLTRGQRNTDGDCICDADEIKNGTNPYDANSPLPTPAPQTVDAFDRFSDPAVWWWSSPGVTPQVMTRADSLTWLQVDWTFAGVSDDYLTVTRRFNPPMHLAYCQKVEADVQAFGSQRLKGELKVSDGHGGFEWVRTEVFMLEAGTRETLVIDVPKHWGSSLEHEGIIDLAEISFTIDRRFDNPPSGTYWIRDIRITGRPCLTDGSCP